MELANVLNALKKSSGSSMQKTASADTTKTKTAQSELYTALTSALASVDKTAAAQTKTASASDELTKIAQDLAGADQEALIKEAQLYGAAVMDGFVARGMQYNAPSNEKVASVQPTQAERQAWAMQNPAEYQKLATAGQAAGERKQLEKLAATPEGRDTINSFNQGYHTTMAEVTKLASTLEGQDKLASFRQGFEETMGQLAQAASGPNGQEKLAAVRQGFSDGTQTITKLAEDAYVRGFNDTVTLMQNM